LSYCSLAWFRASVSEPSGSDHFAFLDFLDRTTSLLNPAPASLIQRMRSGAQGRDHDSGFRTDRLYQRPKDSLVRRVRRRDHQTDPADRLSVIGSDPREPRIPCVSRPEARVSRLPRLGYHDALRPDRPRSRERCRRHVHSGNRAWRVGKLSDSHRAAEQRGGHGGIP
jgi:hypothetical protein